MEENSGTNIELIKNTGKGNNKNSEIMPETKKKSLIGKIFKIFFVFAAFVFLLIVTFFILLQTDFFKTELLHIGINELNKSFKEKESVFYAESIEGGLLTKFSLNKISIVVKNDTMLKVDKITLDYNLWKLLEKNIVVNKVELDNPEINFTKIISQNDTLWNFAYLLKPEIEEPEDTSKSEFDWGIEAYSLKINNGNLRMLAFKNRNIPIRSIKMDSINYFNTDKLDVIGLNLDVSGKYYKDRKAAFIRNMSFATNSKFGIKELTMIADLRGEDKPEVKEMKLVTNRSDITINTAKLEPFNLFQKIVYEDFADKNADVDIKLNWFDVDDLTFFLPDVNFLDGKYFLDLSVKGKYRDLHFERMRFNTGLSSISINGYVKNLHSPADLYLDVFADNVVLDPYDTELGLPGLNLPDFRRVGKVQGDFTFAGEPTRFSSKFDISSAAGNVSGRGRIDLKQPVMYYQASVKAYNVDLVKITGNQSLAGKLNSEFTAEGKGVDYKTMTAKLNYNLTNSSIFGQNISKSGGDINVNKGILDLNMSYSSNTVDMMMKGIIDFRNFDNVFYNISGFGNKLDLSTLTGDKEYESNLNFKYGIDGQGLSLSDIITGKGFNPDKLLGKFNFDVDESKYDTYLIPASPLAIALESLGDGKKKVLLYSNFIDFEAIGNYSFMTMPQIIASNLTRIGTQIADRININKTDSNSSLDTVKSTLKSVKDNMEFTYKLNIKNFMPVNLFMDDSTLTFRGVLDGSVKNLDNIFTFNTKGKINYFSYQDSVFKVSDARLKAVINETHTGDVFKDLTTDISFIAPKVFAGSSQFDSVTLKLLSDSYQNKFTIKGRIDTSIRVNTTGNLLFGDNKIGIIIDTLLIGLKRYTFINDDTLLVDFIPDDSLGKPVNNIFFNKFSLIDSSQRISLEGLYSVKDTSNLHLIASRINIPKLQTFASEETTPDNFLVGNIRRLKMKFEGTLKEPKLYAELNTDPLRYDNYKLGRIDAILEYEDNILKPDIAFYNINNLGKLLVFGSLPIQNPLYSEEKIDILNKDVDFKIIAENFQIKLLERYLPFINDLNAKLNSDLNVKGKMASPELSGTIKIDTGRFVFDLTNVKYNFDLNISTAGQNLVVNAFRLKHPSDETKFITLFGNVSLQNLIPSDINLLANGDVKILDNNVKYNKLGVYGDILAGSGKPPLQITGDINGIKLSGNLLIKKGKVVIPPSMKDAYNLYSDNILYKILIDSASYGYDSTKYFAEKKSSDSTGTIIIQDAFSRNNSKEKKDTLKTKTQSPFIYDVSITMENKLFVNMIIDEKTKQEFFGEVIGTFYADNKDNDKMQIRGKAELSDNSVYKFYKNFKATGNVIFSGEVTNPNLNINAVYSNTTTDGNSVTKKVDVVLDVTGNAQKPILNWKVLVEGSPIGGNDPTGEAISYILFGKLTEELSASQRLDLVSNVGANVSSNLLSGMVSRMISNLLPFIMSTDINYVGNQPGSVAQNTDIRFTAGIGDATIRFGGQILTDLSNTNFVIEYPINKFLKLNALSNNVIVKFERLVDPFSQNKTINLNTRTGGGILYQFKF